MMPRKVISHRDFVKDLARGAVGEEVVEKFLREEFGLIAKNVSEKNPDFDLIIDELDPEFLESKKVVPKKLLKKIFRDAFGFDRRSLLTVEVKFDAAAAKYDNFFIETTFDIDNNVPGTIFKCKADLIIWLVPKSSKQFKVYIFKRPELLSWLFQYIFVDKKIKLKVPGKSPFARGIAISIDMLKKSFACLGEFDYTL
jgi:hypothetical protein